MIENTIRKTDVIEGSSALVNTLEINFSVINIDDIDVYASRNNAPFQLLEYNTDYTISKENDIYVITFDIGLGENDKAYAIRNTPKTQIESSASVSFKSNDVERALDRATMQIQELTEDISRAIKVKEWQQISPDDLIEDIYNASASATVSAQNASISANSASSYAQNSATYANNSHIFAEGTDEQVQSLGGEKSAKSWANDSADSATDAALSVQECQDIVNTALSKINIPLFAFHFYDYVPQNNQYWVNSNSFNWLSGNMYMEAYNHLVADIAGKTTQTETIGNITITYKLADDGHKIVDATQETNISNLYNTTGVAWYYILDTTNTRFKLPRTKYSFVGLRDNVGAYVPESLPNITGRVFMCEDSYNVSSGAFYNGGSSSGRTTNTAGGINIDFDASRSSSTYQDNAPVQQRATQMYLYFYVK